MSKKKKEKGEEGGQPREEKLFILERLGFEKKRGVLTLSASAGGGVAASATPFFRW